MVVYRYYVIKNKHKDIQRQRQIMLQSSWNYSINFSAVEVTPTTLLKYECEIWEIKCSSLTTVIMKEWKIMIWHWEGCAAD